MKRYRSWRPNDAPTLAEWIENEISTGEFDEAICENLERDPKTFADVIGKLIKAGEFDEAVIDRADALGYEEVED